MGSKESSIQRLVPEEERKRESVSHHEEEGGRLRTSVHQKKATIPHSGKSNN